MIYLDSAATTLEKPGAVPRASAWAMTHLASPGRGGHAPGMGAAKLMYQMREQAARLFGVSDPERVVLTCNATHGLNIAIRSLVGPGGTWPGRAAGWWSPAMSTTPSPGPSTPSPG